jgi:hypothetical protein
LTKIGEGLVNGSMSIVALEDRWIAVPLRRKKTNVFGCGKSLIDLGHLTYQTFRSERLHTELGAWRPWNSGQDYDQRKQLRSVDYGPTHFLLHKHTDPTFRLFSVSNGKPALVSEFVASFPVRALLAFPDHHIAVAFGREPYFEVHYLQSPTSRQTGVIVRVALQDDVAQKGRICCGFTNRDGSRLGIAVRFRKTLRWYEIGRLRGTLFERCLGKLSPNQRTQISHLL